MKVKAEKSSNPGILFLDTEEVKAGLGRDIHAFTSKKVFLWIATCGLSVH